MNELVSQVETHIATLQRLLISDFNYEQVAHLNALYELRNNLRYVNDVPDVVSSDNAGVIEDVVNTVIKHVNNIQKVNGRVV